ncbi:MAG TPA: aminopeptidase P family protein [Salinivirga sp.]|uniref:aminopeptidase P family protein n=1 Tax=Salinivirga sp. TaxID=1970192 RepID=UPI002B488BCA|nr:aminopeptidase P family protein [Salinivirga sp.]HKK60069.1 aminopeptidase P family protein [Salinivirga sp.]
MFKKEVYTERRNNLKAKMSGGIAFFPGHSESPMNAPANTFHFRQNSSFLYYFGLDFPDIAGVVDLDSGESIVFGDDVTMDDIIWMGPQPSMKERCAEVGVTDSRTYSELFNYMKKAVDAGRKIHFLPQYRADNQILMEVLTGIRAAEINRYQSVELIKAVVAQRSIKDEFEIEELKKAAATGYNMHVTAMKMAMPGVWEQKIAGTIEGIAVAGGGMLSFPVILSQNGQTLHNHDHSQTLKEGRLMLTDAGAETGMHYASDFTRTVPVGGKFSDRQRDIYNIVLAANNKATSMAKPGIPYFDVHVEAAKVLASGLKDLGIMKGNPEEAARTGAYALFQPHGLGHMMGLDVHDMEDIGENYVGYDEEIKRSEIFGLAGLRLGRKLQPGFVLTNEPGCYFIPELIDKWESEKKFADFINYDKVREYIDFGGIRLEDDLLITDNGAELIGDRIPISVEDVEKTMNES